jgi:hypothetical protein
MGGDMSYRGLFLHVEPGVKNLVAKDEPLIYATDSFEDSH